ncbi:mechanosensitive ion channel family protein [Reinekea marina]|uniref:Mechanosensitive ion channel family protein n=1 Tax=Reinekea marina TaxID=1310421 RepID=A0ABV7WNI6_9GAMM
MSIEFLLNFYNSSMAANSELVQLLMVLSLWPIAWLMAIFSSRLINKLKQSKSGFVSQIYDFLGHSSILFSWFFLIIFLIYGLEAYKQPTKIVQLCQSLILLLIVVKYSFTFIKTKAFARVLLYTIAPLILLDAFNALTPLTTALDAYDLNLGNFHISLFDIIRVIYFGGLLFWLGKESSRIGKQVIRNQSGVDSSTREVIAKLFEVALYVFMFLILLNVLGINLTTLAVFGGAIGVGIGFGLQSIASNFISGLIILLDRSLSIGDYIEFEDGRSGTIRELNLRAITLETFDGKDIVVPNDVFSTETFINWTHKNDRQRYSIDYSVAYHTDLDQLFPLIKDMLCAHPKVLSGSDYSFEEQPDVEISGFGDNGIDLHIEFWMEAIDDGEHRVGGDLLYELWKLMNKHGFEFPFPQREVRLLKDKPNDSAASSFREPSN